MMAAKVSLSGSPERERAMVPGLPGRQHEAFSRAADFRIYQARCMPPVTPKTSAVMKLDS